MRRMSADLPLRHFAPRMDNYPQVKVIQGGKYGISEDGPSNPESGVSMGGSIRSSCSSTKKPAKVFRIQEDGPSVISNNSESGVSMSSKRSGLSKGSRAVSRSSLVLGLLELDRQDSLASGGSSAGYLNGPPLFPTNSNGIAPDQSSSGCYSADLPSDMAALIQEDEDSHPSQISAGLPSKSAAYAAAATAALLAASVNSHHSHHSSASERLRRGKQVGIVVDPASKTATIRQHYYPEGGWGWIVVFCAFVVQILVHGLQLSFGFLLLTLPGKFPHHGDLIWVYSGWLGAMSLGVSLLISPVTVGLCRRKSTRLTAVLGGLVTALGCLFTSFATQFHQLFFSYGAVIGIGVGLTRDTSTLMVGQYFKRRREFVEIFVVSGSGLGISLMSLFVQESINSIGWRLGLQAVTGCIVVTFFVGTFYRSATLYHPQRRAILHLKNQRRKIKDKSGAAATAAAAAAANSGNTTGTNLDGKIPILDFSSLRSKTLQILLIATSLAAFGLNTPIIYLAHHAQEKVAIWTAEANQQYQLQQMQLLETTTESATTSTTSSSSPVTTPFSWSKPTSPVTTPIPPAALGAFGLGGPRTPLFLQIFLGLGWTVGTCAFGFIVVQNSTDCRIARLYLCQASVLMCGFSLLALTVVEGYQGYVLFVWIYGVFCGGYHYSLKMFTFEKVRARNFPRAWGFVQCSQALPVAIGVPFSGYMNVSFGGKAGYYLSAASVLAGGATLFLINIRRRRAAAKLDKKKAAALSAKAGLVSGPGVAAAKDRIVSSGGDSAPWCKQLLAEAAELSSRSSHGARSLGARSRLGDDKSKARGQDEDSIKDGSVACIAADSLDLDLDLLDDVETRQALALLRQAAAAGAGGSKMARAHHLASLTALSSFLEINKVNKPELTCISEEGIADMDLPDNLLDDLDIDLDIDIDLAADCITSCNQMENYLLMSEFEANLNYTGTDDGEGDIARDQARQDSSCCDASVASTSTATAPHGDSVSIASSGVWRRSKQSLVKQLSALRSSRKSKKNTMKMKERKKEPEENQKLNTGVVKNPEPSSVQLGVLRESGESDLQTSPVDGELTSPTSSASSSTAAAAMKRQQSYANMMRRRSEAMGIGERAQANSSAGLLNQSTMKPQQQ